MTAEARNWLVHWKLLGRPRELSMQMLLTVPEEAYTDLDVLFWATRAPRNYSVAIIHDDKLWRVHWRGPTSTISNKEFPSLQQAQEHLMTNLLAQAQL